MERTEYMLHTHTGRTERRFLPSWLVATASILIVVALAAALRIWNMGATFESSDQAAMAYLVRYEQGLRWVFAHDYGPVLPGLQLICTHTLAWLQRPLDETAARIVPALLSLIQVLVTYPLLRRLHASRSEAWAGALVCAVLPAMVSDAHYPWAGHTCWLLGGTLALWGTLTWLDQRRRWPLVIAAFGLTGHCLSGSYAFAVPLALLWLWQRSIATSRDRGKLLAFAAGFVLPCIVALTVIVLSWWWTGQGQLGHLLRKSGASAFGVHPEQIPGLPAMWTGQLGVVFGCVAGAALVVGLRSLYLGRRVGLLALWGWAGLVPFVLLADWNATGYAGYYLFDVVYVAAMLGVLLLMRPFRPRDETLFREVQNRTGLGAFFRRVPLAACRVTAVMIALTCFVQLGAGSLGIVDANGGLHRWSGITAAWGAARPDSGIKAACWYVRQHVPPDGVILCVHERDGMEVPVAEYYLGRKVLAGYDLQPRILPKLLLTMQPQADVIIAEPRHAAMVEALRGMDLVGRFTSHGQAVRLVYARRGMALPRMDSETGLLNDRYDRTYPVTCVPIPLHAAVGFEAKLLQYQQTVRDLRHHAVAGREPEGGAWRH